jgi:hypothetical protein
VVINLWEETVWAGFFETRLENRFNIFIAGVLTAVPSAGVHMPLLLIGDHTSGPINTEGHCSEGHCRSGPGRCCATNDRRGDEGGQTAGLLSEFCIRSSTARTMSLVDSLLDDADAGR